MCRNVLIYFTKRHAENFLERLAEAMDPAAYLFVGAAETLWQMTDRFEPAQIGACYVYRPCRVGSGRRTTLGYRETPEIAAPRSPGYVPGPTPIPILIPIPMPIPAPAEVSPAGDRTARPVDETGDDLGRVGRQLLADGSLQEAIVAFRQWAYLSPDDPTAHFQLGSALDAAGARVSALRAYRAALAALDRCDPDRLASVLHGYDRSELRRLLADRCLSS
jgi:chemotaxis protein methyltransferase CheR